MPKPRALTPGEAKATLAHRFGRTADNLRQLATKFGVRPTRVWLVHTLWSGAARGEGVEREIHRLEILPTPRVKSLDRLALSPFAAGVLPVGSIQVDRVSSTLTYDVLRGRVVRRDDGTLAPVAGGTEDHIGERVEFYYEAQEDGRGDDPAYRMRFRLFNEPQRRAGAVEWTLTLERAGQDHLRDGKSAIGTGLR